MWFRAYDSSMIMSYRCWMRPTKMVVNHSQTAVISVISNASPSISWRAFMMSVHVVMSHFSGSVLASKSASNIAYENSSISRAYSRFPTCSRNAGLTTRFHYSFHWPPCSSAENDIGFSKVFMWIFRSPQKKRMVVVKSKSPTTDHHGGGHPKAPLVVVA